MSDELLTALLPDQGLRILLASTGELSRKGRDLHGCLSASAALFAQGLTLGVLMGALQKEQSRVNLQLECDGPVRGLFVDASSRGTVRGYVKNPVVEYQGAPGQFEWRPVLGNSGFLSVLRDRGAGEYYRSATQLEAFDLVTDTARYFEMSEQLKTEVFVEWVPKDAEALFCVAGMLLQPLPDGDRAALGAHAERLRGPQGFASTLRGAPQERPDVWLSTLFPGGQAKVTAQMPLLYQCTCSRERVLDALASIGKAELEDLLAQDGKADMTCEFCMTRYDISGAEIRRLLSGGAQA